MLKILIPFLLFISNALLASVLSSVDADLKIYDDQIAALNLEFAKVPAKSQAKEWVKIKINHMVKVDQYMRQYWNIPSIHQYTEVEKKEFNIQFSLRSNSVDQENTSDMKELLKIYTWFKISEFGTEIDKNAWLLVQHADHDPSFQKEILIILTELYKKAETNPSNYAYLWDRVAASWSDQNKRTLQRYGTQGRCVGHGVWQPLPVEDPDHLDERRQAVGLGSEAEYIKFFKNICL
jgi:hypothetical protein